MNIKKTNKQTNKKQNKTRNKKTKKPKKKQKQNNKKQKKTKTKKRNPSFEIVHCKDSSIIFEHNQKVFDAPPQKIRYITLTQMSYLGNYLNYSRLPLSRTLKGPDKKFEIAQFSRQRDFEIARLHQEKIRDSEILRIH